MNRPALILILALVSVVFPLSARADGIAVYPVDRAEILAGSVFDLKVEFPAVIDPAQAKATVNGTPLERFFGKKPQFIPSEAGGQGSALLLRDVSIGKPGRYAVEATDGTALRKIAYEVYGTGHKREAKNVILFIGDGMSMGHRTAARVMSKGIVEGRYQGNLVMDTFPHTALVGTSGVDSLVTDSANSATAYTTGHKSSNNALCVYADRTPDPFDDPKTESIGSLARRRRHMSVGFITNTEIQDATPASMYAHTRRRAEKAEITRMLLASGAEVIMGGGGAYFLSKDTPGSSRTDGDDFYGKFRDAGYAIVSNATELASVPPTAKRLLGIFHTGNMDGVLDRKFLHKGTAGQFPDQPDLTDMTRKAIGLLSKNPNGFILMVESGLIDKYSHELDWERAVMDTIMLDKSVAVAKEFAGSRNDTLVLVTADHTHPFSVVGTEDDGLKADDGTPATGREKVGVYGSAGYPLYQDQDGDGYPDDIAVSKRLAAFFAAFPDYYETFGPKMDGPFQPATTGKKTAVANEVYKNVPGAMLRAGNIPAGTGAGVHSADDVILNATGPGSGRVAGFMDNTDVFRVMVQALALGP